MRGTLLVIFASPLTSMHIIRNKKTYFFLSGILALLSILSISIYGFRYSTEFTGGVIVEAFYADTRPEKEILEKSILVALPGTLSVSIRESGDQQYIIRTAHLKGEGERNALKEALTVGGKYQYEERRFSSIGPIFGKELATKALLALFLASLGIILYVALAFSNTHGAVSSWKYGVIAVIGLIFDILIPLGVFSYLSHIGITEIDLLFVTALLVILGYCTNDTIVVFDRVRENLRRDSEFREKKSFEHIVGASLWQTLGRSINTVLTVVIVLVAIFFFGGEVTKMFSLALLIGVISGVYSTLFFSTPLLVIAEKFSKK